MNCCCVNIITMLNSQYLNHSHVMRWHQHNYFADPQWDPFVEQYREHLDRLDQLVIDTGSRVEGSLIYHHHQQQLGVPWPEFVGKRRFVAMAALGHKSVLEIGFNAGHSALIMLTANPQLKFVAVDIGWHAYAIPCFNYLHSVFGDRIEFIHSDSLQAWPFLMDRDFDLVHIDGNHEPTHLEVDLVNAMTMTRRGTRILVDDVNVPYLKSVVDFYRVRGDLIPLGDPQGQLPPPEQGYYLNNRGR